jgi:hypothetical protein
MELATGLVAILVAWWAVSAWRTRAYERAMALRRITFHEARDVYRDSWAFDFVEMLVLYEYRVLDWPPIESNTLYVLRRSDGPRWEIRLHPDCEPYMLAALERDAEQYRDIWDAEEVAERRRSIHRSTREWKSLDNHQAAQVETHYQLFLTRYTPTEPTARLDDVWRRLVAFEQDHEKRRSSAAAAPRGKIPDQIRPQRRRHQ